MYRQKRIITRIGDTYENIDNRKTPKKHKKTHKCSKKHKNDNVAVIRNINPHKNSVKQHKTHFIIDIVEEEVINNNKTSYNIIATVIDINNK